MTARPAVRAVSVLLLCLATGAAISEWLGQDANYDLTNYHLYDGWAFLHGRLWRDLLPAGMQSTFNPLLDALYAQLALGMLRHAPRVLAALMGCWAGAAGFLAWRLAGRLYPGQPALAAFATVLALSGVGVAAEIGTTFNDIPVAAMMLAGLVVATDRPRGQAAAGLLFGAAAGLKLTALVFAPAGCLAVLLLQRGRAMPRAAMLFAAAWLAGWAVTDGWWALMLWRRFDSPVFLLLNGVFRSPWYPPANFVDDRFLPSDVLQALVYPVYWFFQNPTAVGEAAQRDPRLALAMALGLLCVVTAPIRRMKLPPMHRAVLGFWVAGYAAWVSTSGILRYALVLEVLAGLCLPMLVARLLPRRTMLPALAAVALVAAFTTRYAGSPRVPYAATVLRADTGFVRPNTLVVLTLRVPSAHIVPLMPFARQLSVIGLDFALMDARGWRLHDEALRMVAEHDGPISVVTAASADGRFPELGEIGLDAVVTSCRPVTSTFVQPGPLLLYACDAKRTAPPPMPSPFWHQAAARYRTVRSMEQGTGPLIGAAYLLAAGPIARGTRFLDWTDLLWNGVGRPHDTLPAEPDPATLYVLGPEFVAPMAARMDHAADAIGTVDGVTVLAPGWLQCPGCTAPITPLPDR